MKNKFLIRVIYFLLIFSPIVDTATGVTTYYFANIGLSIVYKSFILILLVIHSTFKKDLNTLLLIVFFILLLLIKFIFQSDNLTIEFIWLVKIFFFMIVFTFLKHTINDNLEKINLYFKVLLATVIFNLLGGSIFEYGYYSYKGAHLGNVGFYIAPNEMGGVLVVTASYLAITFIHKKSTLKYILISSFMLIVASVTIMKASILGVLLVFIFTPFIYFHSNIKNFKVPKFIIIMLISMLVMSISFLPLLFDYIYNTLGAGTRLNYALSHGLVSGLLSHRDVWAMQMMNYFMDNVTLYNFFFGYAYEIALRLFGNRSEIDIVDIFFSYGIVGITIIYGFWIRLIYLLWKLNNIFSPFVLFSIILIFFMSLTSGHIINSGLGSIPFSMLFSMAYITEYHRRKS